MAKHTVASTNVRIDALEARIDAGFTALAARLDTLAAPIPQAVPAPIPAAAPTKVDKVNACACGAEFRFGYTAAQIAAQGALGLCGLKGRTAHRGS